MLELPGEIFLVSVDRHRFDVAAHDVADSAAGPGKDELAEGQAAAAADDRGKAASNAATTTVFIGFSMKRGGASIARTRRPVARRQSRRLE